MYKTLIHERVEQANQGKNPTAIIKLNSGWVVLGDNQIIPGYCLLLSDPVANTINDLDNDMRSMFLLDMTIVGDALMRVLNPRTINYSILGNKEIALHAHIHPRYDWEKDSAKYTSPFIYSFMKEPKIEFDPQRDKPLIDKIKKAIEFVLKAKGIT